MRYSNSPMTVGQYKEALAQEIEKLAGFPENLTLLYPSDMGIHHNFDFKGIEEIKPVVVWKRGLVHFENPDFMGETLKESVPALIVY